MVKFIFKKKEQDQGKGLFQEINVKAELKHEYEKGNNNNNVFYRKL